MSTKAQHVTIEEIAQSIDIPDSAYDQARKRYLDLGEWFSNTKAESSKYSPHIHPQGSFRLGTATKPLIPGTSYDLDLGCRLQEGINKSSWTQQELKEMVGDDLEQYRQMRSIKRALEEKHRCWCLNYADELGFHMDVVPYIPEEFTLKESFRKSMVQRGETDVLAESVANHAGAITDNQHVHYNILSDLWNSSNSEGYAIWFESRTRLVKVLEKSVERAQKATIAELPFYKVRLPLQRCVQILKRHRDIMFRETPDNKPASIILTTLAAQAYEGEDDIVTGVQNILSKMGQLVGTRYPRIPNPINPAEDFVDRWRSDRGRELNLEENFWAWLHQAQTDIGALGLSDNIDYLLEKSLTRFGAPLDPIEVRRGLGVQSFAIGGLATATPKSPVDYRGESRFG